MAKVDFYGYMVWFLYRCGLLSFSFRAFPFLISVCVPFGGCLSLGEVVGGDFEAYYLLWCSSFGEVGFVDLETRFCFFFDVLI